MPEHAPPATCIKTNTTRTRNDEKISRAGFDCAVAHLLFDDQKGDTYNEAWVKDTNGFDILMGQFAHNIENIWGFKEVVIVRS